MKRRQMNALAHSLCAYLCSRNHDIAGGQLCAWAMREEKQKLSFKIYPGRPIAICGHELTHSVTVTSKLVKFELDTIEGRMSFFRDGRYPHGAERYTCGIAIAITQGGRTGLSLRHVACWPHDATRERRRESAAVVRTTLVERVRKLLGS